MQNRIEKKFFELKSRNEKALICFVTSGDPDLKTSQKIINRIKSITKTILFAEAGIIISLNIYLRASAKV